MIIQHGNRQIIISDNHSQYYDEVQIDFDHLKNIGYMFETHKQVGSPYPLLVVKCEK